MFNFLALHDGRTANRMNMTHYISRMLLVWIKKKKKKRADKHQINTGIVIIIIIIIIMIIVVFFWFLFFVFCVPQLYLWGFHHFWARFLRM